jgi:hypothetical protein
MIQLTNLTAATPVTVATAAKHIGKTVHNRQKGITVKHSKNLITIGDNISIPVCEIIKLAQFHDPSLCPPKPVDPTTKTP